MSILEIDLTPELQARLQEEAAKQGIATSDYARAALERLFEMPDAEREPTRSIMELHGLGAEIWKDEDGKLIDAQEYVNQLRQEWDQRP